MSAIVLNFHGLGSPPSTVPPEEAPYWLGWDFLDALLARIAEQGELDRFEWTFDDGNASDYEAARKLASLGIKARFFVLVGRINQPGYLSADNLKEMVELGMIVGLHGRNHLDWRVLDDHRLADETQTARAELSDLVGAPVDEVAIPFGAYNRRVLGWLKNCQFSRIHTSDGGLLKDRSSLLWPRNSLRNDMTHTALEDLLAGNWSPSGRLRRRIGTFFRRHLL